jgi:hypothetical protein
MSYNAIPAIVAAVLFASIGSASAQGAQGFDSTGPKAAPYWPDGAFVEPYGYHYYYYRWPYGGVYAHGIPYRGVYIYGY